MKTRSIGALALVLGLITSLMMVVGSVAVAQTTNTQLAFVNGASADPVSVTLNDAEVATDLAFATGTAPAVFESGEYTVAFSDGSTVSDTVPPASASTVVSGFGEEGGTANFYPVTIEEIPADQAKVVVWNASTETQTISVDGSDPIEVAAGEGLAPQLVAAGAEVSVQVGEVTRSVTAAADNYIDMFVVSNGAAVDVASVVIPSMQALVDAVGLPTVPDVTGQSAADATTALTNAGYVVGETQEASDDVEVGLVIRSEPAGGTELATGETVTIVVSTGPGTVAVPDVVGLPAADAASQVEAAGLTSSAVEEPSEDVEAGLVISTNPSAGTEVAAGTEVVMSVSTGPGDVEVPDFVGMTVDEAQAAADAAGLSVTFVEDPADPDPDGIVIEQDPEAGAVVPAGSEVTLQLSPATEDPWTSIKVDPDRLLTAGGINFLPDSTSEATVLGTDMIGRDVVGENGHWLIEMDISSLDVNTEYEMLITGTGEDGEPYEQTFTIPPAGETTEEPVEEEGLSPWFWVVVGLLVVALIALITALVMKARGTDEAGDTPEGDAPAADAGTDA
ncbi:MAG: PASTA domain-containing protein [Acidimicrobiia bacterium]